MINKSLSDTDIKPHKYQDSDMFYFTCKVCGLDDEHPIHKKTKKLPPTDISQIKGKKDVLVHEMWSKDQNNLFDGKPGRVFHEVWVNKGKKKIYLRQEVFQQDPWIKLETYV